MSKLFDEKFIAAIRHLRLASKDLPRGGRHAEQQSVQMGPGLEFRNFRAYAHGDDFRRIDWNLYRRLGKVFIREFDQLEDLPVYMLLDVSDSMFFDDLPRADAGRQIAAALGAAALNQHDTPSIYPFGQDLATPLRSLSGRGGLVRMLAFLDALRPCGPTDLAGAIRGLASRKLRSGLAVVVSDFFDPRGIEHVVDALRTLQHRLLLVQVVRQTDAAPQLAGELRLIDCETEAAVEATITASTLDAYRKVYDRFQQSLLELVAQRQAGYVALDADLPVVGQLPEIFPGGVLYARSGVS